MYTMSMVKSCCSGRYVAGRPLKLDHYANDSLATVWRILHKCVYHVLLYQFTSINLFVYLSIYNYLYGCFSSNAVNDIQNVPYSMLFIKL